MQSSSAVRSGLLSSTRVAIGSAAVAAAAAAVVALVAEAEPTIVVGIATTIGLAVGAAGTWRVRTIRRFLQQQQAAAAANGMTHELAEARTSNEAAMRAVRHAAHALGATAGELVFFTPPNRTVNLGRFRGGRTWSPEEVPGDLREMLTDWMRSDPVSRRLGPDDTHPLRPWLRAEGLADAVVVPLLDPEPHGVLVVGNTPAGAFNQSQLDLAGRLGREVTSGMLRVRRHETLRDLRPLRTATGEVTVDVVTGLPDERVLDDHLQQVSVQEHHDVVVAVFGLDDLATIRSQAGDQAADAMCREVGARLLSTIRRTDLVAIDGDRFAVVMHGVARVEHAMRACERLVRQLERPVMIGNHILRSSASGGVSTWDQNDGQTLAAEQVLQRATQALESAIADPHHAVHLYAGQAHSAEAESTDAAAEHGDEVEVARG